MRKLTSDDIAGEIYKKLRKRAGWIIQPSYSGENAHLQIVAADGTSFIVYISPISPLPAAEDLAADALWQRIKNRLTAEQN